MGRETHKVEMKIKGSRGEFDGSWLFFPVVTKEDEDYTQESREGFILGAGWMPGRFDNVWNRGKWENVWNQQEFVGIVTTGDELQYKCTGHNVCDDQICDMSIQTITQEASIYPRWLLLQV